MLYFSLPNFCEYGKVNGFLRDISKINPEYFKTKVSFFCQTGAIPYCSWSGGLNSNIGNGVYHNDLIDLQHSATLPLRINMSNVLLEQDDYNDTFAHVVLNIMDCGSNVIEISSIPLMELISEKYPNYRFTFSKNADLITEFTPELIDTILQIDDILTIGIPEKHSRNLEWLKALPQKTRCEITVNPKCTCDAKTCDICLLKEHQNQLDYSGQQLIENCGKKNNLYSLNNVITIEEIQKVYAKMGFNRFTFASLYGYNPSDVFKFYVHYFIKPEHHMEVYSIWESYLKSNRLPSEF